MNQFSNEETYDTKVKVGNEQFSCFSKKYFNEHILAEDKKIIGFYGKGIKNQISNKCEYEAENIKYYPFVTGLEKYKVIGYIRVANKEYIALIKKKHTLVYALIGLVLAISLCIGGWLLLNNESNIDNNAKDYTPPVDLKIDADPDHITVPGFSTIKMKANTDVVYVALWNPDTNPCYFKYTIKEKASGKTLYASKLIPPGKAITNVPLNQKVQAGSMEVIIQIETYSLDNEENAMNGSNVECILLAL